MAFAPKTTEKKDEGFGNGAPAVKEEPWPITAPKLENK